MCTSVGATLVSTMDLKQQKFLTIKEARLSNKQCLVVFFLIKTIFQFKVIFWEYKNYRYWPYLWKEMLCYLRRNSIKDTTRKEWEVAVFFDQPFLAFGVNIDIYIVNSNTDKYRPKETQTLDNFLTVKLREKWRRQRMCIKFRFILKFAWKGTSFWL